MYCYDYMMYYEAMNDFIALRSIATFDELMRVRL